MKTNQLDLNKLAANLSLKTAQGNAGDAVNNPDAKIAIPAIIALYKAGEYTEEDLQSWLKNVWDHKDQGPGLGITGGIEAKFKNAGLPELAKMVDEAYTKYYEMQSQPQNEPLNPDDLRSGAFILLADMVGRRGDSDEPLEHVDREYGEDVANFLLEHISAFDVLYQELEDLISQKAEEFASSLRAGKLDPSEIQGAVFQILADLVGSRGNEEEALEHVDRNQGEEYGKFLGKRMKSLLAIYSDLEDLVGEKADEFATKFK